MTSLKALVLGALFTSLVSAAATGCATTTADSAENADSEQAAIETHAASTLPGKRVLLLPFHYEDKESGSSECFASNATQLKAWYERFGATVTIASIGHQETVNGKLTWMSTPEDLYSTLTNLRSKRELFDRVITLGHGATDGPIFSKEWNQIGWDWPNARYDENSMDEGDREDDPCKPGSKHGMDNAFRGCRSAEVQNHENLTKLAEIGGLIHDITRSDGFVYVGSCSSGAQTEIEQGFSYLQVLTCMSARKTWGTTSETACWDVTRRVEKLEGPSHIVTTALVSADPAKLPAPKDFSCISN